MNPFLITVAEIAAEQEKVAQALREQVLAAANDDKYHKKYFVEDEGKLANE